MNRATKSIALLATLRAPNVPSVACNVITGILLAGITNPIHTPNAVSAIACGILLYLAGNLLNDWNDRKWDAIHRPERALPQKIFHPSGYLSSAIVCSLAALAFAATNARSFTIACAILCLILIYTKSHKSTAWAIIPMGLCRALLPTLGYFACHLQILTNELIAIAAALFIHTAGLSLIARSKANFSHRMSQIYLYVYPLLVVIACLAAHIEDAHSFLHLWLAALPYLLWMMIALTLFRKSTFTGVSMLLAGIPLVDLTFILPFAVSSDKPLPWLALCVPLYALILGKSLQKIVPAT